MTADQVPTSTTRVWSEERLLTDGAHDEGHERSGPGREMGRAGFEEHLETRSIAEGL